MDSSMKVCKNSSLRCKKNNLYQFQSGTDHIYEERKNSGKDINLRRNIVINLNNNNHNVFNIFLM